MRPLPADRRAVQATTRSRRGAEIDLVEPVDLDPGEREVVFLAGDRGGVGVSRMFHEEHEVDLVAGLGALLGRLDEAAFDGAEVGADVDPLAGFLGELADEGLLDGFAGVHMAAGEVVVLALEILAEEDLVAVAPQSSGDDLDGWGFSLIGICLVHS